MLIFKDGECVKEIGGAAINDIDGGVETARPSALDGVPLQMLRLVDGAVVQRELTEAEVAAASEAATNAEIVKGLTTILVNLEARVSALEGKTVTPTEAKDALKATLTAAAIVATKEAITK